MPGEPPQLEIVAVPRGIEFSVKTVPNASRTRLVAVLGSALKVTVAAPPDGGRANAQLIDLLSGVLGRRTRVEIRSGGTRPLKRIYVEGLAVEEARRLLSTALKESAAS